MYLLLNQSLVVNTNKLNTCIDRTGCISWIINGSLEHTFTFKLATLNKSNSFELLQVGSYCIVETNSCRESTVCYQKFLNRLEKMLGSQSLEMRESYKLPEFMDQSEYSKWIGALQDILMRFSSFALKFLVDEVYSDLGFTLKDRTKALNRSMRGISVCIDKFIRKGCPVDDADPYIALSLLMFDFKFLTAKFRNSTEFVGRSMEKKHMIYSLKHMRNTIAHLGHASDDSSSAPRKLSRPRILQTLCNIAELCFEMKLESLEGMVNEKLSELYPHRMMKIMLPKKVTMKNLCSENPNLH